MTTCRGALWLVFTLCVASYWDSALSAQTTEQRIDSIRVLHEVVVQTTKETTAHQTISRTQIDALPSSSVADALKYMAGVQIKDYGGLGGQKTVNVRSLGSQHVGVYLDGVRITNVQNGTVDLGKYSLTTLETVSLFNANKAERLMTASEYASASTVYMRTRRPDSTTFVASYANGSFGTHKANATYTLCCSKGLRGFVDGCFTHTRGDYPFAYHTAYEDTTGTRRNSDLTMYRLESCAFYRNLQWHTYYYHSQRGLPGGVVRRISDTYTDVGREWDDNFFSQLSYRTEWGAIGLRGILKYANDNLHYRSDYPENISVHANNRYHQQDMYGACATSYEYKGVTASLSSDLRWSDLTTDVRNFHYVYRMDSKTSLSAFYQLKGWELNASGLYTYVKDHTQGNAEPMNRFTWNTQISYTRKRWIYRTFYKSVFRTPTLNDLYYTLVGNRHLKPEYTKQWDVGVTYLWRHDKWQGEIQADGYYNHVQDRIVCLPLKGSYQWTMLNYGYTRCMGMDVSAKATYRHHSLMLSGTLQDDRNRTDPSEDAYNDYIAYSPRWSLTAIYTFSYKRWMASISHMYVDRRYWTAENAIEPPLSAYNCTDLKVCYRFPRHIDLEVECQDMTDERYEIIQRWPMPGRRFTMTIKYTI